MKKSEIGALTKLSYGTSGFGQHLAYGLIGSYLMYFYTEYFGIGAIAAGTLFLVARIWDGINDPLIGALMEKRNAKPGRKLKPFIWIGSILMAVFTFLCFLAPDVNNKLLYAYITYIGWGMSFTVIGIANTAAAAIMTRDDKKRTSMISLYRLGSLLGTSVTKNGRKSL